MANREILPPMPEPPNYRGKKEHKQRLPPVRSFFPPWRRDPQCASDLPERLEGETNTQYLQRIEPPEDPDNW
jgi:hypothetical protein